MSKFKKAKPEQAKLKIGFYGLSGSGKTATALLLAEGLAKISEKKIAYLDTEHGTDFYAQPVPERAWHPEAFDFDALYTRSLAETLEAVKTINTKEYGVIIIDSISHIWEAAINAYDGKMTKIGTVPLQAWGKIKKPYKELMTYFMNLPIHAIICGRQGNEFDTNEETGDLEKVGVKMKAEGETPYEPHILVRMSQTKQNDGSLKKGDIVAYFEKDRSGLYTGKEVVFPSFRTFEPLLKLLGEKQAHVETPDEIKIKDACLELDEQAKQEEKKQESKKTLHACSLDLMGAKSMQELELIWESITKRGGVWTLLTPEDKEEIKNRKDVRKQELRDD